MHRFYPLLLLLTLFATASLQAATILVPTDQPTLQAAVNAAAPGDVIELENDITEGLVTVPLAKNNITIDGKGFTLNSTSVIWGLSVEADNVTIQNLIIDGAGTFGLITGDPANGGNFLTLTNVTVQNCGGSGFAMTGVNDLTMTDITATDNGGNGISFTSVQNVTLTNYTSSGNMFTTFSAGIGIFSSDAYTPCNVDNITITGTINISEPVPVYSTENGGGGGTCAVPSITNLTFSPSNINFTHFMGIGAASKFYYTSLADAFAAADATLAGDPSQQPFVHVENIANGHKYVNPSATAPVDMSFQAAIDFGDPGDIIFASAGSIDVPAQVVVDKNISIQGAGKGVTIITLSFDTGNSGDARGWFLVDTGADFGMSDLTLDGSGRLVYQAIRHRGGAGSYTNVQFTEIKYNESGPTYQGVAIAAFGTGPVNVTGCMFSEIGRVGVLYFESGVSGSQFIGNMYTGKGPGDHLDYALDISADAVVTAENNTITNNLGEASSDGSASAGILVSTFLGDDDDTEATLTCNDISNNTIGIAVGFNGSDASSVSAENNNIQGNTFGMTNTNPGNVVSAPNNYWGAPDGPSGAGPGSGDSVEPGITFAPFLSSISGCSPSGLSIPTMGQWALFLFGLFLFTLGTVVVYNLKRAQLLDKA